MFPFEFDSYSSSFSSYLSIYLSAYLSIYVSLQTCFLSFPSFFLLLLSRQVPGEALIKLPVALLTLHIWPLDAWPFPLSPLTFPPSLHLYSFSSTCPLPSQPLPLPALFISPLTCFTCPPLPDITPFPNPFNGIPHPFAFPLIFYITLAFLLFKNSPFSFTPLKLPFSLFPLTFFLPFSLPSVFPFNPPCDEIPGLPLPFFLWFL